MSTKIYNGWRIPWNQLSPFIRRLDCVVLDAAADQILAVENVQSDLKGIRTARKFSSKMKAMRLFADKLKALFDINVQASLSMERNHSLDLNCSMAVWKVRNGALIRFFGENWFIDVVEKSLPKYCKDYHYQDQVEQPEDITELVWQRRCDDWDEVYDYGQGHMTTMLVHEFINAKPPTGYTSEMRILRRIERKLGHGVSLLGATSNIRPSFPNK